MYDVECTPLFVCSLSKGEGEEGEKKRVRERESSANLAEPFEMCTKHTVSTEGHALTCISACHRSPSSCWLPSSLLHHQHQGHTKALLRGGSVRMILQLVLRRQCSQ